MSQLVITCKSLDEIADRFIQMAVDKRNYAEWYKGKKAKAESLAQARAYVECAEFIRCVRLVEPKP